jgi:hypothetical protein
MKSENEYKEPMKKIQDMKNSNLFETQETEETTIILKHNTNVDVM